MTLVSYFPKTECAKPFFWRPEFIRQFGAIFAPNDPCPLEQSEGTHLFTKDGKVSSKQGAGGGT